MGKGANNGSQHISFSICKRAMELMHINSVDGGGGDDGDATVMMRTTTTAMVMMFINGRWEEVQ